MILRLAIQLVLWLFSDGDNVELSESFVKHQLFPDQPLLSRLNCRYYPTRPPRDLTNQIYW